MQVELSAAVGQQLWKSRLCFTPHPLQTASSSSREQQERVSHCQQEGERELPSQGEKHRAHLVLRMLLLSAARPLPGLNSKSSGEPPGNLLQGSEPP